AGKWLSWMRFARPLKHLWQQLIDAGGLGFFIFVEAATVAVVGFVPNVPQQNAVIVRKGSNDALHIFLQLSSTCRVHQPYPSRRLDPAGVVYARNGRMLWP